jgi:hypothetical protein
MTATMTSSKSATPSVNAAEPGQNATAALPRKVGEVRVGEALADVFGRGERGFRPGEVAGGRLLERVRQHDVSAFDAVVPISLEETSGARDPTRSVCEFARTA